MRNAMAWSLLILVFLLAGEGFNLFRIHIIDWLAYGRPQDAISTVLGLVLGFVATAFLGGFIYHRDRKRGKLKREGWRGRPVKKARKGDPPVPPTATHNA